MEELTLRDYFSIVHRRKWLVIFTTIIFILAGVVINSFNSEQIYKTYTSLIVNETKNNNDLDNNQKYLDQKFMNTYSEIVKSKLVINEVKKNLNLDSSIKKLSESINVDVVSDTDVIKIEVVGNDPEQIARIANEISKVSMKHIKKMSDSKDITVIDKAQVPDLKTNLESDIKDIIIHGIIGLLVGSSIVFLLEHLDKRIKSPKDLEKKFNIPVIGVIQKVEENFMMDKNLNSFAAENYRNLMINIDAIQSRNGIKSVLITSFNPNEGNSLISTNIASTIARTKGKVLLIDGNLKKPKIHTYFKLKNDYGLSNVLNENIDYREVIYEDKSEKNLHVLTSGLPIFNSAELLSSRNMKDLLEEISKEYDTIIIDSPSVGGVTDSVALSTNVDGTILVCSAGETDIDDIKKGKELLDKVNANILGIILDKVIIKNDNYYKYYYNNYSYYNDRKEEKELV
ncbi:polysaccharide biosynthesis tyrosine autokinase [Anaerosalibacter bizertensis]|nr:polysaccharide biosynthesis tyrosine autokinase [Anaerosalibacter bizertensis]MBU5294114.1 polysaccharide biosynthesis tyrosine autokinase [Anaerosalibacter bizertensis]